MGGASRGHAQHSAVCCHVRRLERQARHQNNTQDQRSVDHAGQQRPLYLSRSSLKLDCKGHQEGCGGQKKEAVAVGHGTCARAKHLSSDMMRPRLLSRARCSTAETSPSHRYREDELKVAVTVTAPALLQREDGRAGARCMDAKEKGKQKDTDCQ